MTDQYPKTITLGDNVEIELRLMTPEDRDAIVGFAQALPEEDLLFLRMDLTQPEVVDEWIRNVENGSSTTLVAYDDKGLIGYVTVHRNTAPWTRRVGEIRVNVSKEYRSRGLGKKLTSEIFQLAQRLGVRKLVANMIIDQHGAQAAFRRLGFVPEAVLADHVEDRNGRSRDLVIMSYDIEGHTDQAGGVVQL